MREERKLNKAIKQDGIDTQSKVLEELKRRYPQYFEQSTKPAPKRKRRVAVISALAAAAVCAAIVVPCAVLLPNSNNSPVSSNSSNSGETEDRYCTQDEYSAVDNVDYTIGEYRANNGLNFLYFDWYETCEDCITGSYISNSDNEVLCIKEKAYLPETDEMVQLSITKANVYLSVHDSFINDCNNEQFVNNHAVKWGVNELNAGCIFEDDGYRYFIQIELGQDENRLFELVAELLENN